MFELLCMLKFWLVQSPLLTVLLLLLRLWHGPDLVPTKPSKAIVIPYHGKGWHLTFLLCLEFLVPSRSDIYVEISEHLTA